jgi:hypothetical protein
MKVYKEVKMGENEEADRRKLLDIWDGPIVKPASTDTDAIEEPKNTVETSNVPKKPEARAIGSTTLGATRGWSGGWID